MDRLLDASKAIVDFSLRLRKHGCTQVRLRKSAAAQATGARWGKAKSSGDAGALANRSMTADAA